MTNPINAIRDYCECHCLEVQVADNGKHVIVRDGRKHVVNWWPHGKGRVVYLDHWKPKRFTLDYADIIGLVEQYLNDSRPARELQKQLDHLTDIAPTRGLNVRVDPALLVRLSGGYWPRPAGESQDAKPQPWLGGILASLTTNPAETATATG